MTKTPDEMLTEEEIQKLIWVCENSKERALISCIFDAALQIEEAGYLRWRQIQKLKYGIETFDYWFCFARFAHKSPCQFYTILLLKSPHEKSESPQKSSHAASTEYSSLLIVLKQYAQ